ncbi:MAG: hypothetical protein EBZ59_07295 [Planctomycetia bacterium]|nr:hypothetical protein [Planctomycetia bacterium]
MKSRPLKTGVGDGLHLWAPAPKHNGSATSRAAAERVEAKAPSARYLVLKDIRRRGAAGATHEEIALATGIRLDTVKARVHELGMQGVVRALRRTRATTSGSAAMVFVCMSMVPSEQLADWPRTRESHWKQRALEAEAELARLRAERELA